MEPDLNREINTLRGNLSSLNSQKQEKFKEKDAISKQIVSLITDVKKLRVERDGLTDGVKTLKEQRSELNKVINKLVVEIKEINKDKKTAQKKLGLKKDPTQVKTQIDDLNEKVETEVLSFDKEQKLMKQIRELEKLYAASSSASELWDKAYRKSREIKIKRDEADTVHRKIQQKANESQEKHIRIVESSKEIDELKVTERGFIKELNKVRNEIRGVAKQLEERTGKVSSIRAEKHKKVKQRTQNKLAEKQRIVEQKIANGDKLTTEDLLVLQSIDEK